MTALDLIKCLKQIKRQILLLTCVPDSNLPSDISTMPGEVGYIAQLAHCNLINNNICQDSTLTLVNPGYLYWMVTQKQVRTEGPISGI